MTREKDLKRDLLVPFSNSASGLLPTWPKHSLLQSPCLLMSPSLCKLLNYTGTIMRPSAECPFQNKMGLFHWRLWFYFTGSVDSALYLDLKYSLAEMWIHVLSLFSMWCLKSNALYSIFNCITIPHVVPQK